MYKKVTENTDLYKKVCDCTKKCEPVAVLEKDGSVVTSIYQDASPVYPEDKYPEKIPRRVKMLVDKSTLPIGTLFYTTPQTKPSPDGLIDPKSYYIGYEDGKKAPQTKDKE